MTNSPRPRPVSRLSAPRRRSRKRRRRRLPAPGRARPLRPALEGGRRELKLSSIISVIHSQEYRALDVTAAIAGGPLLRTRLLAAPQSGKKAWFDEILKRANLAAAVSTMAKSVDCLVIDEHRAYRLEVGDGFVAEGVVVSVSEERLQEPPSELQELQVCVTYSTFSSFLSGNANAASSSAGVSARSPPAAARRGTALPCTLCPPREWPSPASWRRRRRP